MSEARSQREPIRRLGNLDECDRCQGVFPNTELQAWRGRLYCKPCHGRLTTKPEPASPPPAPRLVQRTFAPGQVAAGAPPTPFLAGDAPVSPSAPDAPDAQTGGAADGQRRFDGRKFFNAAAPAIAALDGSAPGASATPAPAGVTRSPSSPVLSAAATLRREELRGGAAPSGTSGGAPALSSSVAGPDRETAWARYAELRQKIDASGANSALLTEAAELASSLDLELEAQELRRDLRRADPASASASVSSRPDRPVVRHPFAAADPPPRAAGARGGAGKLTAEARPFWEELGAVLAYPFRGKGVPVLLAGSVFFAVAEVVGSINVFGWIIALCVWGYVAAYLFDVVNSTAAGKDEPPEFPEVLSLLDSMVFPFFALLGCLLFSFLPVFLLAFATMKGWLPPVAGGLLALGAVIPSAFVFPMTLMARGLFESVGPAMSVKVVYGSILRIPGDYIAAFVALCVMWVIWAIVRVAVLFFTGVVFGAPTADALILLDGGRIVGWLLYTLITWPLLLYVWMLQGHVLGRLYRQGFRRLAWFTPPTEETQRASRLSAGIVAAGLAGSLFLVGGVYLTWKLWPEAQSGAARSSVKCPIASGSSLTYFWENTDGPAGLVTYRFEAAGGDKLRITADIRRIGEFGIVDTSEPAGVLDTSTGVIEGAAGDFIGGFDMFDRNGRHTRFFGPRHPRVGSTYVNETTVRGETKFQDHWAAWHVLDPESTADHYYDKATGVLVGRRFSGVGFQITEWLTSARGVAGLTDGPPPNRHFPEKVEGEPGDEMEFPFPMDDE